MSMKKNFLEKIMMTNITKTPATSDGLILLLSKYRKPHKLEFRQYGISRVLKVQLLNFKRS